jgi:hypothetical protein
MEQPRHRLKQGMLLVSESFDQDYELGGSMRLNAAPRTTASLAKQPQSWLSPLSRSAAWAAGSISTGQSMESRLYDRSTS